MGLFSRNESATGSGRRPSSRASLSSEAQATELRGRARRRLIGALALVLAAVIIVPMLFDSTEPENEVSTPVVVPAVVPPTAESNLAAAPSTPDPAVDNATPGAPVGDSAAAPPVDAATPADTAPAADATVPDPATTTPAPPEPAQPADAKPKPAEKPEPRNEPKPKPSAERTDDGSVAIALLEGRTPSKSAPAPAAKGNYILQIAAYTNDKDAQSRRDKLVSSGVTNAYVENATSGGKATYRLRVGPFPTRDAAQAAQARLRALGYDNGFISTK
jgi:DedD protein